MLGYPQMADACIIDGKKFSAELQEDIKRRTNLLKEEHKIIPGPATVLVGEDPASDCLLYTSPSPRDRG